jgi:hypothetical protein
MPVVPQERLFNKSGAPSIQGLIKGNAFAVDPVFTFKWDHSEGYLSLPKLFLSYTIDDPTEVTFAEEVFGNLPYWLHIRETSFISKELETWRFMADLERKKRAFKTLVEDAKSNPTSAKYLIEEPWKPKTAPSKKKTKATSEAAFSSKEVQEDLERLKTFKVI